MKSAETSKNEQTNGNFVKGSKLGFCKKIYRDDIDEPANGLNVSGSSCAWKANLQDSNRLWTTSYTKLGQTSLDLIRRHIRNNVIADPEMP